MLETKKARVILALSIGIFLFIFAFFVIGYNVGFYDSQSQTIIVGLQAGLTLAGITALVLIFMAFVGTITWAIMNWIFKGK